SNQGQQQAAIVEPDILTSTIAPAEPPTAPQTAAALPTPDPIEPTAPSASASAGAAASGYVLQLASYKSEAEARADYERLRQRHGGIIGGLSPEIQKTDLAGGGTFYRLSLGPVDSRQAARTICGSLLAAGERDCLAKAR
ncbi:MAG TPA: SPOR domain-containing protein, partial [Aestuariivirgaceae bacterium]|nr:SPOR domain-containing protein [Aestuariivirgaceae bacterium]